MTQQGEPFGGDSFSQTPPSETTTPNLPENPTLKLSITPTIVRRGDFVTVTIESNMPGSPGEALYKHERDQFYSTLGYFTLDETGSFNGQVQANSAGWWSFMVRVGTVDSNVVEVTIQGVTIYQEKDHWSVGETYTGALTSTYRNWGVMIWIKNHTDTLWNLYIMHDTDEHGMIPFGTLTEVLTTPGVYDLIAIIDRNDPSFWSQEFNQWAEEHDLDGYQDDILSIPDSIVDKSNILTFQVS